MAMMKPLVDMNEHDKNVLFKELGRMSALLYAPELLHFAHLENFQEKIDTSFEGVLHFHHNI